MDIQKIRKENVKMKSGEGRKKGREEKGEV